MTQEEKDLLLKDLCARVPYHPKGRVVNSFNDAECDEWLTCATFTMFTNIMNNTRLYLRPMSSITEEEREDFWKNVLDIDWRELEFDEEPNEVPFPFTENDCGVYLDFIYLADLFAVFDWLNAHHFDYRGLIPKGLAISTEEFNPYKD